MDDAASMDGDRAQARSATPSLRAATPADAPALARLVAAFLGETYGGRFGGSPEALERALAAGALEVLLAVDGEGAPCGFAAWERAYDLHHAVAGGHLIDLYVAPPRRGRGLALALVAAVAARVRDAGGVFLRGQAAPVAAVEKLYRRVGVLFPGAECNVGGRAFRALADLDGVPARAAIRRLPDAAWNHEP